MLIKIEVTSDEVNTRNITSKDGKPLVFREQPVFFHLGDKYPRAGILQLGDHPALTPGIWTYGPGSFDLNKYNQLQFSRKPSFVKEK